MSKREGRNRVSVVSIVRLQDDDVEGAVKEAVSLTQSFESVEWKSSRVLIKPNVVNTNGGWMAWAKAGYPVE